MTSKILELVKQQVENAFILMIDVKKPETESERILLRQIREYAISILCECNKLLT